MTDQTRLFDLDEPTRVGHCDHLNHHVYIGRSRGGDGHMLNTDIGKRGWLGNPYPKSKHGRRQCVDMFRQDFEKRLENDTEFREAVKNLQGLILGCYCQRLNDDGPLCHGEVIADHVDRLNE